jgi:hypothetical protein
VRVRVAGQHHQRPLRPEAAVEQRLRETVGPLARLPPRQRAPAVAVPLGREHSLGVALGAGAEQVRHAGRVRSERLRGAHEHAAVGAALRLDARAREDLEGRAGHAST